ncbi:alpha/beta hydrolase family protein [Streptomyces catenulae]|uniref:Alpha/beta hydrolase n=1 Tax=Streptomyces catenulae TaxID=66875 RepID=A0ABV2YXS7_9ACTN|nr:alpha/beta hydrolase [Streptomyces catenulae]
MSVADEEAALLGLAPVAPHRSVTYGPHPDQRVDLYDPAPGTARGPHVVLVHGGFWRAAYDRTHLSPAAAELARRGLPVALAEYRRVGGGGGGERTFDDVAAAVAAATAAWAAEGPAPAPVLVGHSAGGQLVLLTAARGAAGRIGRVVAVAPVADLAAAHRLGLSDHAVAALLGDGPGFADRLAAADPVRHPPAGVPVTVLHGTDDPDVPPQLSRSFAAAARAAGAEVALRELPGVGHYAPFVPSAAAFRTLLGAVCGGC